MVGESASEGQAVWVYGGGFAMGSIMMIGYGGVEVGSDKELVECFTPSYLQGSKYLMGFGILHNIFSIIYLIKWFSLYPLIPILFKSYSTSYDHHLFFLPLF